ncbi:MAG: putative DNA binding domain-containing protein [Paludibacter sp.]|nr:putative DNA binding domain-containing protein [Paludibacter sp.]
MNQEHLRELIAEGEKSDVEFKKCSTELSASFFETICAFLNRDGGHLIIGVTDDKNIVGVNESSIENIIHNLHSQLNNIQVFNPTIYLSVLQFNIEDKKILYINVPESPQVHRYKNKVFDRTGTADNDISFNFQLIDNLHLKKRKDSSENEVLPYITLNDLDESTFRKMRQHIAIYNPAHPWLEQSNEEMLKTAGFWRKDPLTNREGFVLAAVLLFGKEQTILSCCSYYRTDAIYRNLDYERYLKPHSNEPDIRYDDRDLICENLILAYSRLMNFVQRNLPDKFSLDEQNLNRIDLRNIIFREIVANLLVHREFTNSYPAKFLIFSDRVITENWSKQVQDRELTLDNWDAHTKNPLITKVFREMKWVEELGSGRKNIKKYAHQYFNGSEILIDNGDKFIFSITYKKYTLQDTPQVTPQHTPQHTKQVENLLKILGGEMSREELMSALLLNDREYFRKFYLKAALELGLIEMTIPTKPNSKYQKYRKVKRHKL